MTTKIEVPALGDSITEATVATWLKKVGDFVQEDELIAELETDKVNLEVIAPTSGKITSIATEAGATVAQGDVMGELDESAKGGDAAPTAAEETPAEKAPTPAPEIKAAPAPTAPDAGSDIPLSPAVKKLVTEKGINPADVTGTGKDGRLTKGDVLAFAEGGAAAAPAPATAKADEERVPMTRMRKTIAKHLKNAQNTAAMLTTYNEVDLGELMELRAKYKDKFLDKNGVKLGFMGFFTKAVVEALKDWPALNSQIDGEDIIYKNYYDIGIAVGSEKGLVVPVVRDADKKDLAGIEGDIADFGARAKSGNLKPDELTGGTFTITNGGVFGSMMSMPILNYPQSGILGMHATKERPVVVNGEIVIRPMMYLALTYDHRVVDGREAVSFLVKVKECLEDPARMLVGI